MKDLRIVFMGTPDFATTILKHLVENNQNVVGVITAPDKPAGRGRKLNESSVKKYAVSQNLTVLQPTNLKNEDFLQDLKNLNANLQVVVAFRMLPKQVWQNPKYGTFNLHASLLPDYRGAAPIHWAIINGETKTGVSTFFIDEKIDTGAIIQQKETSISADETVGELHDKLMVLGAKLVLETIKLIKTDTVETTKQPVKEEKSAPKLFPENSSERSEKYYSQAHKVLSLQNNEQRLAYIQSTLERIKALLSEDQIDSIGPMIADIVEADGIVMTSEMDIVSLAEKALDIKIEIEE